MEPPHNQTVPVNSVVSFTCTTLTDVLEWEVTVGNSTIKFSLGDQSRQVTLLEHRGIRIESDNKSVLLVNATLKNNGMNIRCLTGQANDFQLSVKSNTAILIVFGE